MSENWQLWSSTAPRDFMLFTGAPEIRVRNIRIREFQEGQQSEEAGASATTP